MFTNNDKQGLGMVLLVAIPLCIVSSIIWGSNGFWSALIFSFFLWIDWT